MRERKKDIRGGEGGGDRGGGWVKGYCGHTSDLYGSYVSHCACVCVCVCVRERQRTHILLSVPLCTYFYTLRTHDIHAPVKVHEKKSK